MKTHVSLTVSDLARSIDFYRVLLGAEPAKRKPDYAKFEPVEPALVLSLVRGAATSGGALNHAGIRVADSKTLVRIQERLEAAGIRSRREEGVECCYALQTKFWVADPDGTMWEVYVVHSDLDEHGRDAVPVPSGTTAFAKDVPRPRVVWQHRLGEPLPARIPHENNSLHEALLEGSFNGEVQEAEGAALLVDVFRALRPGGEVRIHGLAGDRRLPPGATLALPGPAAAVRRVPVENEPLASLRAAGFAGARYEILSEKAHFHVEGVSMREILIVARKPGHRPKLSTHVAIYQGPFSSVTDDHGNIYPRGERVRVNIQDWQALGIASPGQFLLLPPEEAVKGSCAPARKD